MKSGMNLHIAQCFVIANIEQVEKGQAGIGLREMKLLTQLYRVPQHKFEAWVEEFNLLLFHFLSKQKTKP